MPFAAMWTDLEIVLLRKVRHRKQVSYNITHMWNLKKKKKGKRTYLQNISKVTDVENKLWLPGDKGMMAQIGRLGLTYAYYLK